MEIAESDVDYLKVNAVFNGGASGAVGEEYMVWAEKN